MDELYGIDDSLITLADDKPLINHRAEADRIATAIFKGEIRDGDIDPQLTRMVAEKLAELTKEAFKGRKISFGDTDSLMMEKLQTNAWHFASAKNYHQIKSMSEALTDKAGKVRSWKAFRTEAEKINRIYNEAWLRTEYETATGAAINAARWSEWQSRGEDKMLLTYDAVNDERTRASHKALDGITKPMNDPFWATHYPPNGWRCRCGVMAAAPGKKAYRGDIPKVPIPEMFRTNLAKGGLLFPLKHPYFHGAPQAVKNRGENLYIRFLLRQTKQKLNNITVKTPALDNAEVSFNSTALKEAFNQGHYDKVGKAYAVAHIDEILPDAKFVTTGPDLKNNDMVEQYHYLSFLMKSRENYIVIREMKDGRFVFYSIVEKLKDKKR